MLDYRSCSRRQAHTGAISRFIQVDSQSIESHPSISGWQSRVQQFGIDPTQIDALLKQAQTADVKNMNLADLQKQFGKNYISADQLPAICAQYAKMSQSLNQEQSKLMANQLTGDAQKYADALKPLLGQVLSDVKNLTPAQLQQKCEQAVKM